MSDARAKKILTSLAKREAVLRTQVRSVCQGYTNACFVHGPGGLGKTHLITTELESVADRGWIHHTAYSTSKALMISLTEAPDAIHLFEDCENLYKQDTASSILRAACGSPKQKERWITYETAHEKLKIKFTGGVIIVSNENLSRSKGPLAAVASRFRPVEWNLATEERVAKILDMAKQGWTRGPWTLTPAECTRVAEFLIEEMLQGEVGVPVDLRTYNEHALPAFAMHRQEKGSVDWKEIVRSKLVGAVYQVETRTQRTDRLQQIALVISKDKSLNTEQRAKRWKEETGLGLVIYYRHLRNAKGKVS